MMPHVNAHAITNLPGLIAFWDFQTTDKGGYTSLGPTPLRLRPVNGTLPRSEEGVFGPASIELGSGPFLHIPRQECGALNLYGENAAVSVIAWLKRFRGPVNSCQAVAGIWNEYERRQYCLFLNLGALGGREKIGGHISSIGGATPGHLYCMDAAIGGTDVPFDKWQVAALSYDSQTITAWLNGHFDPNGEKNPYSYPGGIFDGGEEGGDFTVGAVLRPTYAELTGQTESTASTCGNHFQGLLGGLAIFNRALTAEEHALMDFA